MDKSLLEMLVKIAQFLALPFRFPKLANRIIPWAFTQRPMISELARLADHANWYRSKGFNTVIDVGANIGAYCFAMRALLPEVNIYAFEPIPECYERLNSNLNEMGKFKAFHTAVGNHSGTTKFHHNAFHASSSILAMDKAHKRIFPSTSQSEVINVPITRLDEYINQIELEPPVLLKIDVQGYEDQVLLGAEMLLTKVDFILTEVSYISLYKGQPLFDDIYYLLKARGFQFMGNQEVLLNKKNGDIIQSDAIFMHTKR